MTLLEIKKYMKQNKITYAELSKRSSIPEGTLKHIFAKADTANPQIYTMQAIERALGLDEKKPLADEILEQVAELNIADYQNLTEDEKKKIAKIFNVTVAAFKKK